MSNYPTTKVIALLPSAVYIQRMEAFRLNLVATSWRNGWLAAAMVVGCCVGWHISPVAAAVAVISNRSPAEVKFSVVAADHPSASAANAARQYKIAAGDLIAVPLARAASRQARD